MGSLARFLAHAGVAWCCTTTLTHAEQPRGPAQREQCLAAHEQAQDARIAGRLLASRSALRECSAATCPALVSRDCVGWLSEIEQQIPSVIFSASKDGQDVVTLRVREGERLLVTAITGTPLELDPGPHRFVAELPGFAPQDATYVLQAGEKARNIRFAFVTPAAPQEATSATLLPPPASPSALSRPVPTLGYVLAGTTLAAVVTGSVLGTLALGRREATAERCAPLCAASEVRATKNLALGADIAFVIAALSAGGGVYSYVTRPSVPAATSTAFSLTQLRVGWAGLAVAAAGSF